MSFAYNVEIYRRCLITVLGLTVRNSKSTFTCVGEGCRAKNID